MAEQIGLNRGLPERLVLRRPAPWPAWAMLRAPLLVGLLVAVQLAYLASGLGQVVNAYDEGFAVYGAARVHAGHLPYRDFWAIYAPGQFYALAALFELFGESLLVARLWDTAARLALALAVYLVTAALSSPRGAVVPSLVATLWLGAADYYGYAAFPALALSLLSVLALLRYVAAPRWYWLVAAGIAVGLATLFRHDFGAYTLLADSLALTIHVLVGVPPRPRPLAAALLRLVGIGLSLALGVLLVVLPVVVYFVRQVRPHVLWSDLVLFPLFINRQISYLHYPDLLPDLGALARGIGAGDFLLQVVDPWLWFYAPLAVLAAAALVTIVRLWRPEQRHSVRTFGLLLLVLLGLALFNHTLNRYDRMHALPSAIVALAVLLAEVPARLRRWPVALAVAPLAALLAASFVVLPLRTKALELERFPPLVCQSSLPRAGCADLYPDQEQAIEYVRSHTAPGERIFVGNTRHDRVYASDILFYFLADRHSPSRFHELVGAVANTPPVQRQIREDLVRHDVRYVVLSEAGESLQEPNLSNATSGVTLLDDFIRDHYQPVARFGVYTVWRR